MRASLSLRRTLLPLLDGIHEKRREAAFDVAASLLRGGRLTLTELGRAMPGSVVPKHNIKKVDRLLGNKRLHQEHQTFFRAIAHVLLDRARSPIVLVDWTDLNNGKCALAAAVPSDGRALPIYIEVHPEKELSSPSVERAFLNAMSRVVPTGCRPVIIADAGFRNPWLSAVARLGWDFVGRLSANVLVTEDDGWTRASAFYDGASSKPMDLGLRTVAKTNPIDARLVIVKERKKGRTHSSAKGNPRASAANRKCKKRANDPWLLITSLTKRATRKIVELYRTRMQIEEAFRDAKNHRFGWSFEDARSGSCARLEALLLIASMAMLVLTLIGRSAETLGIHRGYQANTTRHKRVLSLFVLGKHIVERGALAFLTWHALRAALAELRATILAHNDEVLV
jgi:hypothetical protein